MRTNVKALLILLLLASGYINAAADPDATPLSPLGLPEVPVPDNNPMTAAKVALGDKLFHDVRFSATGDVSCATCHDRAKAFTDSPLAKAEGINKATGTRNSPTAANAVFNRSQFWDGRSPSLEEQAIHPFINPIEMGLPSHEPILAIVRSDREYKRAFRKVFGVAGKELNLDHVTKAIGAFERTLVFGNSPFDQYQYGGNTEAMSDSAIRGLELFRNKARCVSCHTIEQDQALFTDHQFHNIGVGINEVQQQIPNMTSAYLAARNQGADVDVTVLTNPMASELGRFAVTNAINEIGAFKTPTLRNINVTGPYMHDGSIETLQDVVEHYNNGGKTNLQDTENAFLSGGIRPLNLTETEIEDLVSFMEALTSPEYSQSSASNQGAMR